MNSNESACVYAHRIRQASRRVARTNQMLAIERTAAVSFSFLLSIVSRAFTRFILSFFLPVSRAFLLLFFIIIIIIIIIIRLVGRANNGNVAYVVVVVIIVIILIIIRQHGSSSSSDEDLYIIIRRLLFSFSTFSLFLSLRFELDTTQQQQQQRKQYLLKLIIIVS